MERVLPKNLRKNLENPHGLIQVLSGHRQVGKTTAAVTLLQGPQTIYANADLPLTPTADFIVEHWQQARAIEAADRTLILDEVQKIPRWSEVVKGLWEEERIARREMRVCLLGSSAVLIDRGLSESLTGRFEVSFFPHWLFPECRKIFGATLEEYIRIGGYPKAYD